MGIEPGNLLEEKRIKAVLKKVFESPDAYIPLEFMLLFLLWLGGSVDAVIVWSQRQNDNSPKNENMEQQCSDRYSCKLK